MKHALLKALRVVFTILICTVAAYTQTSDVKDVQQAKTKLIIGTDQSKYLSSILQTISGAATHNQSPTAKAVYDYIQSLNLIADGSAAAGDLDGTYPSPTVDGIQNRPVTSDAPSSGDVLKWNGTAWDPSPDAGGDGNGWYDGSGTVPDGTVATLADDAAISGGDISSFEILTGLTRGGSYFSNINSLVLTFRDTTLNSNLTFDGNGASFNFTDSGTDRLLFNDRDVRYGGDYSATYSARSLVDKEYVDDAVAAVTVTDGDKGDITVSSSGTNWQIDANAVTNTEINDVAWGKITGTPTTLSGYGIGSPLSVVQGGTALSSLGTANQILGVNAGATANEYKTLSGTSNQVTVTHGVGTVTLSTPQNIHTGATPTFSDLTLGDDLFVTDDVTMDGTVNTFTMDGSAANIFNMNGASQFNVGDGTADGNFNYSGSTGNTSIEGSLIRNIKLSASGTASSDGAGLVLAESDGAALTNGHYLGTIYFQSRGSTSTLETGAQISALADGADWTGSSNPTKIEMSVVPSGSDVLDVAQTIRQSGQVEFNNYGSGTFTGTPAYALQVTSSGQIIEGTVTAGGSETNAQATIYPSQITSTQNDYSPTGYSTTVSQTIQVDGDGSFQTITGLSAATRNGVEKTFYNDGTNCYILAKAHTGSSAANRFSISKDVIMFPNMSATFRYDSVAGDWKLKNTTRDDVQFSNLVENSLVGNASTITSGDSYFTSMNTNSGVIGVTTPSSSGYIRPFNMSTSTATGAFPTICDKNTSIFLSQNLTYLRVFAKVKTESNLSTNAQNYQIRLGFDASPDTNITEGALINYDNNENSGGWVLKSNDNSSTTSVNAGSAVNASTTYDLELIYYPYGEVTCFINGARYTKTNNLPTDVAVRTYVQIDKDNGGTARTVDVIDFTISLCYVAQ